MTQPGDAEAAAALGADAIGLVFCPASPRWVDAGQAEAIVRVLPPFVTVVGLFVDEHADTVRDVLARLRVDLLQFHGDEAPDFCQSFDRPYIKAIRMREGLDLASVAKRYREAQGLLLDAYHPSAQGGTGTVFDWGLARAPSTRPLILAGGLTPGNVRLALETVRPCAVDVSSGVESAKGIKDEVKMAAFLREVYEFDQIHGRHHRPV